MLDGVNVSSWARTQKAIATSSGESELYAMSVGAAEALGLRELLTDIGLPTTVRLRCDSTAAMGTASRQGLGRMKHVQVRDLALQQWIADGRLTLTEDCEFWKCCRPSHETCVPECAPVSRPETWSSTITPRQTRLLDCSVDKWKERHTCVLVRGQMVGTLHLCIGTRADGWNVTLVYWYAGRWKERNTCVLVCGQMEGTVHLCCFLVGSRDDGNAPVERMRSERHSWSAL